jgi:hypothetical protein
MGSDADIHDSVTSGINRGDHNTAVSRIGLSTPPGGVIFIYY